MATTTQRRAAQAALAAVLALLAPAGRAAADADSARIVQGFKIAPVPLALKGLDRKAVGLGSYLVNALGGCNDCHTSPPFAVGHDPFLGQSEKINVVGYLAGGQHFGRGVVSPNLTPDAKGLPGGMTFKVFSAAIHLGRDPDHPGRLLQVMPWPTYRTMTDSDTLAIYTYLK